MRKVCYISKISKTLIAATLLPTASAASAEQVIVSCNTTSSTMTGFLHPGPVLYRISSDRGTWEKWDIELGSWSRNLCQRFALLDTQGCLLNPKQFSVVGYGSRLRASLTIDRETGVLEGNQTRDTTDTYAAGTCVPGTEPAPPKTKF